MRVMATIVSLAALASPSAVLGQSISERLQPESGSGLYAKGVIEDYASYVHLSEGLVAKHIIESYNR